jgi:hypothetical protein
MWGALVEAHDAPARRTIAFHQQVPGGWVIGNGMSCAGYDDRGLLAAMAGFFAR